MQFCQQKNIVPIIYGHKDAKNSAQLSLCSAWLGSSIDIDLV